MSASSLRSNPNQASCKTTVFTKFEYNQTEVRCTVRRTPFWARFANFCRLGLPSDLLLRLSRFAAESLCPIASASHALLLSSLHMHLARGVMMKSRSSLLLLSSFVLQLPRGLGTNLVFSLWMTYKGVYQMISQGVNTFSW